MGLGRYLSNVEISEQFKENCFKIFIREQIVNMKSVMEHLRHLQETSSTQKQFDNFKKLSGLVQIFSFFKKFVQSVQ